MAHCFARTGIVVCALLVLGCSTIGGGGGGVAPDFSLLSLDGETISLSQFRGKVVVIDFWATWCVPCRQRLAHLQALMDDPGLAAKGLVVLAIDEEESASDIRRFLAENRYALPVLRDAEGAVAREYWIGGLPTTVVVGRDGRIESTVTAGGSDGDARIDDAIHRNLG